MDDRGDRSAPFRRIHLERLEPVALHMGTDDIFKPFLNLDRRSRIEQFPGILQKLSDQRRRHETDEQNRDRRIRVCRQPRKRCPIQNGHDGEGDEHGATDERVVQPAFRLSFQHRGVVFSRRRHNDAPDDRANDDRHRGEDDRNRSVDPVAAVQNAADGAPSEDEVHPKHRHGPDHDEERFERPVSKLILAIILSADQPDDRCGTEDEYALDERVHSVEEHGT